MPMHETMVMTIPVIILALGALLAGVFYSHFVGYTMDDFWAGAIYNAVNSEGKSVIDLTHHVIWQAKVAPLAASMLGLLVSWFMYIVKPDLPKTLATDFQFFYRFLFKMVF